METELQRRLKSIDWLKNPSRQQVISWLAKVKPDRKGCEQNAGSKRKPADPPEGLRRKNLSRCGQGD
jgi:hypothetical protein